MLDLVYENQTGDLAWSKNFFNTILESAAEFLNLTQKKIEVGVHLITPERSQELNRTYRKKDKPTDVLSFPLDPVIQPRHTAKRQKKQSRLIYGVEEHGLEKYDILSEGLPLQAGDIFICLNIAKKQAAEMKMPLSQELAHLVVHGFLHLLGYGHERSLEEEIKMLKLEEEILKY